ncbi:Hypothetical predicted protein, partial [Pelobates cultripes]
RGLDAEADGRTALAFRSETSQTPQNSPSTRLTIMAQKKGKKNPERGEKIGFFTARSARNKPPGPHAADQDGDGDDTLPLQILPDPGNIPVTQDILKACLEEMSDKLLKNMQSSVSALSKDIQELGERKAQVEHRMGEYAEAHNDLADHVQALEKQLTSAQLKSSTLKIVHVSKT